jgi:putative ABC transport system substrate-binding protein
MKRASVCSILFVVVLLAVEGIVEAQQPTKMPRIGFLSGSNSVQSFREGLRDLGYVEGKNILIDDRYIEKSVDEFSGLVAELLQLKIDVLVVEPLLAIRAAKKGTQTIPIVMVTNVDPVANGIVDSLASPRGNITGLATLSRELSGKRLELFKEVVPRISRIGVLGDADAPVSALTLKEYEAAARGLKIRLQSLEVRGPNPDLASVFQSAGKAQANALITISSPMLGRYRKQIAELAIKNRLPSTSDGSGYVDSGFLMSYSADKANQYRRAAVYVDKILKGAKPADLPVEQPTKFEFIINLKTAKQIGLTIPPNVLARADKVIK